MRYLSLAAFLLVMALLGGCGIPFIMADLPADPDPEKSHDISILESAPLPKPVARHVAAEAIPVEKQKPADVGLITAKADSTATSTPGDLSDNPNTVVESRPSEDFWQELRNQFSLQYSGASDPGFSRYEQLFANQKYFERLSSRGYWFMPYILDQVQKRGMPAEIVLLPAIESAYRADATSRSKAAGMWQFIAPTARRFGLRQDSWMDGRRDLVQSTRAALDYLQFLAEEFDQNWEHVFAAYNAGEGKIRREILKNRKAGKPTGFTHLKLRKETRDFLPRLFAVRNIISAPEKYGIKLAPIPNRQTLAVIDARTQTDLHVAASLIPASGEKLRYFNMGYKLGVTPPGGPHTIVLPADMADQLLAGLDELSDHQRLRWTRHHVRKGEYLALIAKKYRVTVDSITHANRLSSHLIQIGQVLRIPISTGQLQYAKQSSGEISIKDGYILYTIRPGDSLWKISRETNATIAQILSWNDMLEHNLLFPGQKIIIGLSS